MNLESTTLKVCEYFNDIGIIDYDNVNDFLQIYSEIAFKNNYNSKNDILRNTIFSYMKLISQNDTLLFEYARRTLNSFINFQLVSKYKSIKVLKSILNIKIKNIIVYFFFRLIRTKGKKSYRYLIQNYNPKNDINNDYKKNYHTINHSENLNYLNDNLNINTYQKHSHNSKITTENNETKSDKNTIVNLNDNLIDIYNIPQKKEVFRARIFKKEYPKEKNLFELKKEEDYMKRQNKLKFDSKIRKSNYYKIKQQYLNDENQNYYTYYSKNDLKNERSKSQNTSMLGTKIKIPNNDENISENNNNVYKRYKVNIPYKNIRGNSNDVKNTFNTLDDNKNGNEKIKENVIDRLYKKEIIKILKRN